MDRWWRRRESNPRPKALPFLALHACPAIYRHPADRARAPCPPDHLRMNLVLRRRSATEDQPTFLRGPTAPIGCAPGSRVLKPLGGQRELNVVVGVCCVARFLKRHRRSLHAPKGSL